MLRLPSVPFWRGTIFFLRNPTVKSIELENEEKIKVQTSSFDGWRSNEIRKCTSTLWQKKIVPSYQKIKILISATHLQDKSSGIKVQFDDIFRVSKIRKFRIWLFICLWFWKIKAPNSVCRFIATSFSVRQKRAKRNFGAKFDGYECNDLTKNLVKSEFKAVLRSQLS